jgi:hypothetical protein
LTKCLRTDARWRALEKDEIFVILNAVEAGLRRIDKASVADIPPAFLATAPS